MIGADVSKKYQQRCLELSLPLSSNLTLSLHVDVLQNLNAKLEPEGFVSLGLYPSSALAMESQHRSRLGWHLSPLTLGACILQRKWSEDNKSPRKPMCSSDVIHISNREPQLPGREASRTQGFLQSEIQSRTQKPPCRHP